MWRRRRSSEAPALPSSPKLVQSRNVSIVTGAGGAADMPRWYANDTCQALVSAMFGALGDRALPFPVSRFPFSVSGANTTKQLPPTGRSSETLVLPSAQAAGWGQPALPTVTGFQTSTVRPSLDAFKTTSPFPSPTTKNQSASPSRR